MLTKIVKSKNTKENIRITERKEGCFVTIGKKVMTLPFTLEQTLEFLRRIEVI